MSTPEIETMTRGNEDLTTLYNAYNAHNQTATSPDTKPKTSFSGTRFHARRLSGDRPSQEEVFEQI